VDGFRADAVPYLFEREGTNCENLPETHAFLKKLRRFLDENYPGRILLCEANQWPEDVRPYYGDGDEFHLGFHFPLMPRIFQAVRKGDVTPLVWILNMTPPIPHNCQWCTFLRNHDELTLEMVTPEERQWMWQEYAPEQRMRLNLGIRRRLAPLLDNDRRKIELAHSLLMTITGSPFLYYGDEIGMGDNIWLPDRNGVRTPMQWDGNPGAGFSAAPAGRLYSPVIDASPYDPNRVNVVIQQADPASLLNRLRKMIAVRKAQPVLGNGDFTWMQGDQMGIAAYLRRYQGERLLVLNNLTDTSQSFQLTIPEIENAAPVDLLSGKVFPEVSGGKLSVVLEPYQFYWLKV
jgi:maltose alpha-D-glucosyltransferase/alpha-amylase